MQDSVSPIPKRIKTVKKNLLLTPEKKENP